MKLTHLFLIFLLSIVVGCGTHSSPPIAVVTNHKISTNIEIFKKNTGEFEIVSPAIFNEWQSPVLTVININEEASRIDARCADQFTVCINASKGDFPEFQLNGEIVPYTLISYLEHSFVIKGSLKQGLNKLQVTNSYSKSNLSNQNVLNEPLLRGWSRSAGPLKNGVIIENFGVEPVAVKFNDSIYMYFRGNSEANTNLNIVNYGDKGVLRFATSSDGINFKIWKKDLLSTKAYQGQEFVYLDDNTFHLMFNDGDADGVYDFQYWTSKTGLPGSFKLLSEQAFKVPGPPGNISFWKEIKDSHTIWYCLFEYLDGNHWAIGLASGPSLMQLKLQNNGRPVVKLKGRMVGGPEVHKLGEKYYLYAHEGEYGGDGNMPTSLSRYHSTNLSDWSRDHWELLRDHEIGPESQIADPSIIEFKGKTLMYFESLSTQNPNKLPALSVATANEPLLKVAQEFTGDDLRNQGWDIKFKSKVNNAIFNKTAFQKTSKYHSPLGDQSIRVKVKSGDRIDALYRLRKSGSQSIEFSFFEKENKSKMNEIISINFKNTTVKIYSNYLAIENQKIPLSCGISEKNNSSIFFVTSAEKNITIKCNGQINQIDLPNNSGHMESFIISRSGPSIAYYSNFLVRNSH